MLLRRSFFTPARSDAAQQAAIDRDRLPSDEASHRRHKIKQRARNLLWLHQPPIRQILDKLIAEVARLGRGIVRLGATSASI